MTGLDQPDFESFVAARIAALSRTAYLLTGDRHDAEDLVQTALFRAARAWHRLTGDPEPYVRRIMYNENVSRWRRRRVDELATASPPERSTADATAEADTRIELRRALARLTRRQRTMLVLRYFEDLTERATADALGVSANTVKSETRRALARIRELSPDLAALVDVGPDPEPASSESARRELGIGQPGQPN
jgi:RNA polymerase sigma-70 factor (sigma-E family)